jgi:hypothetical protein
MDASTRTRTLPVRHKNDACCEAVEPPRLSEGQAATLAEKLKALADPRRMRILDN